MTPLASTWPSFFRTRFIFFRSSFIAMVWKLRASSFSNLALSFRSICFSYALTKRTRSSCEKSTASLCAASLLLRASARSMSVVKFSSLILRSLTGSNNGTPSGNRFLTSFTAIATFFRASGDCTAAGINIRTAETLSMCSSPIVNTRIETSFSSSTPGLGGRQVLGVPRHSNTALALSSFLAFSSTVSKCRSTHGSRTSSVYVGRLDRAASLPASPADPPPPRFLKDVKTPQP
mmetsp:Transcript_29368/g.69008  ORF Transcript_29368/g.69008 Transcript_29368/m.69008 type:complete len:234 (-) Transcript_29368:2592-3293(-)